MVKLSVIVPFYNVRQYAPDTLRSLRANTREDFEFLLVDDSSRDGTRDVLERAARDLPGAVVLGHERNGGLATARNTGIDASRGTYLTFLDGDDWVAPGYYAQLVSYIEALGCDFVRTDHVRTTGRARSVQRVPHGRRGEVLRPRDVILPADRSTPVDYPYAWAGIYHRRLVDRGLLRFTDGLRTAEDRPWIWRLHREAESFAIAGLLGVFYRRGVASSLTQIGDVRQLDFIRAFDQVVAETAADPEAEETAPESGPHLLRDHFPSPRPAGQVRTAGGARPEVDERGRAAPDAPARPRRHAGRDGPPARHPAAPTAPPPLTPGAAA